MKKLLHLLAAVLISAALIGCNTSSDTDVVQPQKKLVQTIGVQAINYAEEVQVGDNLQFFAYIVPTDAENKNVTWSADNTQIASIDEQGLLKGLKAGKVIVTASSTDGSNVNGTCTITVKERSKSEITYSTEYGTAPSKITVENNSNVTEQMIASITDPNGSYNFKYWYMLVSGEEVTVTTSTKITQNTTFYAKWEAADAANHNFVINYYSEYGTAPAPYYIDTTDDYYYVTEAMLPTLDDTDSYTFGGWICGENKVKTGDYITNKTSTFYAKWGLKSNYVVFSFVTDKGTAPENIKVDKNTIGKIALPVIEDLTDYCFYGWKVTDSQDDKTYTDGYTNANGLSDTEFTAVWKEYLDSPIITTTKYNSSEERIYIYFEAPQGNSASYAYSYTIGTNETISGNTDSGILLINNFKETDTGTLELYYTQDNCKSKKLVVTLDTTKINPTVSLDKTVLDWALGDDNNNTITATIRGTEFFNKLPKTKEEISITFTINDGLSFEVLTVDSCEHNAKDNVTIVTFTGSMAVSCVHDVRIKFNDIELKTSYEVRG